MSRPGRKRLVVDLPLAIYNYLKAVSKKRNISMTKYLSRLLVREIKKER